MNDFYHDFSFFLTAMGAFYHELGMLLTKGYELSANQAELDKLIIHGTEVDCSALKTYNRLEDILSLYQCCDYCYPEELHLITALNTAGRMVKELSLEMKQATMSALTVNAIDEIMESLCQPVLCEINNILLECHHG